MAATQYFEQVQKIFIAFYQRPADPAGLKYWAQRVDAAGGDFGAVIDAFASSPEAVALYGAIDATTIGDVIDSLYMALFNVAPDAAGKQFYVDGFTAGTFTAGTIALAVLNGAQNDDLIAVQNKVQVANEFTQQVDGRPLTDAYFGTGTAFNVTYAGDADAQAARDILKGVTFNTATVLNPSQVTEQLKTQIADATDPIQGQTGGQTFTLTTALGEQVNGTAGNDVFNAVLSSTLTSSTLNVGDMIDGKGGNDTLKLIVDTSASVGLPVGLQVTNVENIEITNGATLNAAIDASAFVGATTIKQIASAQTVQKLAATTTAAFASVETAGLTVTADAAAASANVALDKVKSTTAGNVVTLNVNADAANAALAAVNVAGNIVQKDTTQAANAKAEVQTIDFAAITQTTGDITVGGVTVGVLAGDTPAQVAAKVQAVINAQTLTSPASGGNVTAAVSGTVVTVTFPAGTNVTPVTVASGTSTITGVPVVAEVTAGAAAVAAAAAASLALNVALGKDVQAATVNTAVKTTLTIENAAGSTKNLISVDASASAGDITYTSADAQVATIKTGAGKDTVTLATALDATTKAASVSTGAGDDIVNVTAGAAAAVTGGTTVAVDAGEGKDTINLTISANTVYDVKAGAGDDTVVITGVVKTTDKIDGGDGVDTVSIAGKATYLADDYIVLNKVLTNFETLKLTGVAVGNLDAAQLAASYTTLDLYAASVVDNVSTQALVANGALTAEAAGYKSAAENLAAGGTSTIVYAGTLNITDKGLAGAADAIQAHAETVNLTIAGGKANGVAANNAVLTGEAKTATVTLSAGTDTKSTVTDTSDDTLVASTVTIAQGAAAEALSALTSLTLSGNGAANVTVAAGAMKLVSVDASALNSVNEKGVAVTGLTYISSNTAAETIKLGGGLDSVTLNASTYGKVDTITGLNLVLNAGKTAVDTAKSDTLVITGFGDLVAAGKMTTTQTDLDLALKDAAAFKAGGNMVAFQLGGDTYLFSDKGTVGSVDALDIVVKLTGTVDLDALVLALN